MNSLRALLETADYNGLIGTLAKGRIDATSLLALSLAYRLKGDLAGELLLYERFPALSEIIQRRRLNRNACFAQSMPRPTLLQPSAIYPGTAETLQKLIILTGGDSGFFEWIVEALESVRAHALFSEVTIGVVDCGLTDAQRTQLTEEFQPIQIVDPGFDFADRSALGNSWKCGIPDGKLESFKAITSRAYLDRHFPGFDYYFWIDADAWLQDPNALLDYLRLAQEQGIGISENNYAVYCEDTMFFRPKFMTDSMLAALSGNRKATCAGVVCFTPAFLAAWRPIVEALFRDKGIVNNSPSLWYAIHSLLRQPRFLEHRHQFFFHREGLPLIDEDGALLSPATGLPCGFIHLNGFYGVRERYRYFPTLKAGSDFAIERHVALSRKAIANAKANPDRDPLTLEVFPHQVAFPFRYRVLPPENTSALRDQLRSLLVRLEV